MADNNINDFEEAISIIKSMGFVKTNNTGSKAVFKYNPKNNRFEPFSDVNLSDLFARIYKKSYTNNNWFYPVFNELPVLNFNKVENYYKYCRVMDKTFNVPEMDQQLKYYIDLNNSKKKKVRTIHWKPISQKQQLINNDVFTNGIVLLKHNKCYDFKILAPKQLGQFFRDVEHKENLSIIGVQQNYKYFVDNLVNIDTLFDKLREYNYTNEVLNDCENDYNIIKNMINNFNVV